MKALAIDSKLTAMGKNERAINVPVMCIAAMSSTGFA
jgi:hypothetical protein